MTLSYSQFRQALDAIKDQKLGLPCFALSLMDDNSFMEPHKRPHHPIEWPLPIYHNDNVL